ncbi:MAG: lipid A biosynthesis acyltransferase [Cytophagales bacterium]|nr:lipid A biosynthesis acyltransferase [Cytophagales bacterium]
MSTWKGKSEGNVLGFKIFVFLLNVGGVPAAYLLLRFVAGYYFLFSWSSSKHTWYFFRKRLGYGWFKSVVSLYQNYYVFGQTLIDKVVMMAGVKNKFTFQSEGEEYLFEMAKSQTGGILISAHLGNWEIAGYLLKKLEHTVNLVMFDAEHEKIKDYMANVMKERKNMKIIVVKEDMSHVYAINNALANKEILCMHGDRFVEGGKPVLVSLFGEEAYFPTGPFFLAARYNVPLSYVFALKDSSTHYHFYATKPKTYNLDRASLKNSDTVKILLTDYVAEFEKIVRKYPLQWFNYYDFWKK